MDPAVIGSSFGRDYNGRPKADLELTHLDLLYPPSAADLDGNAVSVVRLIRSNRDDSGTISEDRLRGGFVEVFGGPWVFSGNDYQGAAPGTAVSYVFAAHDAHD